MFSRSAGYSIQALTYLAGQPPPPGKLTGAREIAAARIPMPFLWKILRNLSQQKWQDLPRRTYQGGRHDCENGWDMAHSGRVKQAAGQKD